MLVWAENSKRVAIVSVQVRLKPHLMDFLKELAQKRLAVLTQFSIISCSYIGKGALAF